MTDDCLSEDVLRVVAALPCWTRPIEIEPLRGGLTNRIALVRTGGERFVVRLAGAATVHPIDRNAELVATRAAAAAGIGPPLVHAGAGIMVLRHIDGATLSASDLEGEGTLRRVVDLLVRTRRDLPALCGGSLPDRTPACVLSHYQAVLASRPNRWREAAARHGAAIDDVVSRLAGLEPQLAHNDVHGANLIDDGDRIWLIDWEYAGIATGLVDLASLTVNGLLDDGRARDVLDLGGVPARERHWAIFAASRLAAALRDLFWGYAQDAFHPGFEGDSYIAENERRVAMLVQGVLNS